MADNMEISESEGIICNVDDNSIKCNNRPDVEQETSYSELKRYSRYDLLSLRNDQLSIHHPECSLRADLQALSIWTCRLRCELQYLGLWKVPNAGNQYGNCGNNAACCQPPYACTDGQFTYSSPSCNNVVGVGGIGGGCYTNPQQQHITSGSSPTLGNKRAVRSRERFLNHQRCINTELSGTTSPGEVSLNNSNHQNIKATFIDHRSISSSHLMPAFAKRRMGNVNPLHNNSNPGVDHLGNEGGSDDGDSPNNTRKDNVKAGTGFNDHYAYKTSGHNNRIDNDGQLIDNQPGWTNLAKKLNSDYSPSNNKTNSGAGSAGVNKKLNYERRIGSGRLVQRDANWDMRTSANSKQLEKNTGEENDNIDGGSGSDKLNQRYSSNRYSDPRTQERRLYDRRISISDDSKEKHESHTSSSTGKRHFTNHGGDDRNNVDVNTNQPYQQVQPNFVGQRSMSFRRREYADHREHRDYRDFREQRGDLRDHREQREQKDHHHHHRDNRGEPEWFSEGPTSQHDTIELRGFEEIEDTDLDEVKQSSKLERKSSESSLSHNSSNFNISNNDNSAIVSNDVINNTNITLLTRDNYNNSCKVIDQQQKDAAKTDDNFVANETSTNILNADEKPMDNVEKCESNVKEIFFDNFLNMEALESSLIGGQDQTLATNESGGTSRFSRWFFNSNNNNVSDNEEFIKEESQKPSKDFTESNHSEPNTFMAFLKCNNFPTPELPKSLPVNVSAMSVEELESRMRKMDTSDKTKCDLASVDGQSKSSETANNSSQTPDTPSQDVEAFRKLLDQLGKPQVDISMNIILPHTGNPMPITNPVGVLPTGIISHSSPQANMLKQEYMLKMMHQQQQHQQLIHQQQQPNLIKVVPSQHHLHHQMAQLSPQQAGGIGCENIPLMALPPPHHPQLMPLVIGHPQKRIVDVQHLMQSVVREELSRSFLERELRNPNIPPYAKDIISTVLKESSRLITPSSAETQNTLTAPGPGGSDINTSQHPAAAENVASQNLMQSLARGEVSLNLLEHELNKLNSPSIINETSSGAVYKERSRCVTPSTMPISAMLVTPTTQINSPQNPITTGENAGTMSLSEHQQHALSILRSQHEDPSQHIPTQRELQIHTQAIMQNALLKKKLEVEQHEAIRRRQEMHKQIELKTPNQHQPPQHNSVMPQQQQQQVQLPPARHMNSPTPLAFTPTSVLRKMTAEKDTNFQQPTAMTSPQHQQSLQPHIKLTPQQIHNQQLSYQHVNQPRMILGGGNQHLHHQQQQQHQATTSTNGSPQISPQQKAQIRNQPPTSVKWPTVPHQHSSINSSNPLINNITKPMGRPILKGPIPAIQHHAQNQHQQQCSNQSNQIQSSQPNQSQMLQIQKCPTQPHPRQIVGHQFPTHILQHQNIQHQQMFQQQQQGSTLMHRQQLQHTDSVNNHTPIPASVHHPANTDNNSVTNLSYQRDGGLSPTSNQLAQWFSPELLAQASAGKLPLLNMNQALSLEEFERSIQHSSTAVHN